VPWRPPRSFAVMAHAWHFGTPCSSNVYPCLEQEVKGGSVPGVQAAGMSRRREAPDLNCTQDVMALVIMSLE